MRVGTWLAAALVLALGVAAWWWWRSEDCDAACRRVEAEARSLFERGELVAALEAIDRVDAQCNCQRFTEGDAPPEYSLAVACLDRLHGEGRWAEAERVLAAARGPILTELARQSW